MLVATMNRKEITKEVRNDYDLIVSSSTLKRLAMEYYRERIKLHIKKEAEYVRYYEIKTKSKNKWIIIVYKDGLLKKYQTDNDCAALAFTFYYTEKSICVFQIDQEGKFEVYYGHLFARYRERMGLEMPNLLDVVKYYLKINHVNSNKKLPEKDGKIKVIGILRDGFQLGDFDEENQWWVFKTFIRNETANLLSTSERTKVINNIKNSLLNQDPDEDEAYYRDLANYLEILKKEEKNEKKKDAESLLQVPDLLVKDVHHPGLDFVDFIKSQAKTGL